MNVIKSKKIGAIAIIAITIALAFTILLVAFGDHELAKEARQMQYINKLFGDEVVTVSIEADQEEWDNMIANASAKEYIKANITINGETIANVGVRTKGNASLTQVSSTEQKSRYSLRVKFDEYVSGQTFYGLDSFVMNNMIADTTYMKEYLSQDLMSFLGVETILTNYANISVNGEGFGFYVILETYGDSYQKRVYEDTAGNLYNVKSVQAMGGDMKGGGGMPPNMGDGNGPPDMGDGNGPPDMNNEKQNTASSSTNATESASDSNSTLSDAASSSISDMQAIPSDIASASDASSSSDATNSTESTTDTNEREERFGGGGGGGGGMGGSSTGGTLQYTDDSIDSYAAIFENSNGNVSNTDKRKVIEALKNLSEGTNVETYFDVDEILRYLAAHTFVVNLDSYSSNMAQNYEIYERNGQISILPWDYHLSYGAFESGDASDSINFPIDTPVSGVSMEDRPLINVLLSNEEYLNQYHAYLQEIIDGYFNSGLFEQTVSDLKAKIATYVENDPTAFYTYDEFEAGVDMLIQWNLLRAESVQGQLNGTIPSTTEGQEADPSALIDTSSIDMTTLGSNSMGGGGDRGQGGRPGDNDTTVETTASQSDVTATNSTATSVENDPTRATQSEQQSNNNQIDRSVMEQAMQILSANDNEITDDVKEQLIALGIDEEMIDSFSNREMPGGGQQTQQSGVSSTKFIVVSAVAVGVMIILIIWVAHSRKKY